MPTVQLTTTPAISPNRRNAYVSLVDMMGFWGFTNFDFMRQNGWAIKWTCDGTTGPANDGDATNRITDKTKFQTRATIAGAAQSFFVVEGTDIQILIAFQGATDDVCRISYSPGKLFARAGTATFQPTATDEVIVSLANTVVGAATSLDRVMSIWSTATHWSCAIFRSAVMLGYYSIEKVNPLVSTRVVNPIFAKPYIAMSFGGSPARGVTSITGSNGTSGQFNLVETVGWTAITGISATGFRGTLARVYTDQTRVIRVAHSMFMYGQGGIKSTGFTSGPDVSFNAEKPALQNAEGSPLVPDYLFGEKTAQCDGILGVMIDSWVPLTASPTTPASADQFNGFDPSDDPNGASRANWLMAITPGMVRPWRNAAVSMEVT